MVVQFKKTVMVVISRLEKTCMVLTGKSAFQGFILLPLAFVNSWNLLLPVLSTEIGIEKAPAPGHLFISHKDLAGFIKTSVDWDYPMSQSIVPAVRSYWSLAISFSLRQRWTPRPLLWAFCCSDAGWAFGKMMTTFFSLFPHNFSVVLLFLVFDSLCVGSSKH
jgi:hypothetical protein